jgi:lipopolysaccharide export system ATP-binding protein
MLVAQGLQKSFRTRQVVQDFGFEIRQGEVVGLLGPNGAGKTTCFYMVVGLIEPDGGRITLDGEDITGLPMHQRARKGIGYLPQEASVFRRLTVADNILAVLELRADLPAGQRRGELEALLDELKIGHIADQKGISLSGGERRRVEIARALAASPRFMLLDEPFAGVDPISVGAFPRIVRHVGDGGCGVVGSGLSVREALGICEHAYILNEGKVLARGTPAEILAHKEVREVYLGHEFHM